VTQGYSLAAIANLSHKSSWKQENPLQPHRWPALKAIPLAAGALRARVQFGVAGQTHLTQILAALGLGTLRAGITGANK